MFFLCFSVVLMLCQANKSLQCSCPAESCMAIAASKARCQCCVFVMLGKRSGPELSDKYSSHSTSAAGSIPEKRTDFRSKDNYIVNSIRSLRQLSNFFPIKRTGDLLQILANQGQTQQDISYLYDLMDSNEDIWL